MAGPRVVELSARGVRGEGGALAYSELSALGTYVRGRRKGCFGQLGSCRAHTTDLGSSGHASAARRIFLDGGMPGVAGAPSARVLLSSSAAAPFPAMVRPTLSAGTPTALAS